MKIYKENEKDDVLYSLLSCLPTKVSEGIKELSISKICEIRLRAGENQIVRFAQLENDYIIKDKDNGKRLKLSPKDMSEIVFKLCGGSVYSHAAELESGYISFCGMRVGVCGRGITKDGKPSGFSEYYSLNIRFPKHIPNAAEPLLSYISSAGAQKVGGILVISPPCVGKTTFLRSLAYHLSNGDKYGFFRVCIVDERGEICISDVFSKSSADIISFLPKAYCIELCTRTMSPQYIICDEIGNEKEALEIEKSSLAGVIFAASCHGSCIDDIMKKPHIARLLQNGVFSTVCELSKTGGMYKCILKRASGEVIVC